MCNELDIESIGNGTQIQFYDTAFFLIQSDFL